jgi:hypothetical protein
MILSFYSRLWNVGQEINLGTPLKNYSGE